VVITGAGSGIGRATAGAFGAAGASLYLGGLEAAELERTADDLTADGVDARWAVLDVRDPAAVSSFVGDSVANFGRVDVLVNSAGTSAVGDVVDTTDDEWDRVFDTNVKGVFHVSRAVIPHLISHGTGAIVNVASQLAFSAVAGFAAYCASKAAVVQFTRALALELIPLGVRVNCVCPGGTDTPLLRRAFPDGIGPQGSLDDLVAAHPIGRLARPEEIADAIVYLASPKASFAVGAALVVDGGYVLG
jgi:NAD(P)-dependent dehydrogenase (short-subunit alcohol dehydrogenase family)